MPSDRPYNKTRQPNTSTSTARPKIAREDSELLASYYQSPLADQGIGCHSPPADKRVAHHRSLSGNSTSSSDYSSGSTSDHSAEDAQPAPTTRRSSVPSEGGADRRRLAIVQMDTVHEDNSHKSPTVRSRRGLETHLASLALIAPPDAAPKSYAFSPPASAPATAIRSMHGPDDKSHHRSASDATTTLKRTTSRDVGIVGTAVASTAVEPPKRPRLVTASESLLPPVFQEPHSSPSPSPNTVTSSIKRQSTDLSVQAGQLLRVGNSTFERRSPTLQVLEPRAASPLFPAQAPLSSYLHYQPGVHATAGPLPPPPRAIFSIDASSPPPPRPPRLHSPPSRRRGDLDVVKQALQLPASVSAALGTHTPPSASRSASSSTVDLTSSSSSSHDDQSNEEPVHRREGAFSPSTTSATSSSTSPSDYSPTVVNPMCPIDGLVSAANGGTSSSSSSSAVAPVVIAAPPPRLESLPEQAAEEWQYVNRDLTASPSSDGHMSQDRVSWDSHSHSPRRSFDGLGATPSPPPKSLRTSLTSNLKRFSSLPRTPSPSSKSLARSSSMRSHGRTPSPCVPQPMPRRRKIIAQNPAALYCSEVASRKNALERCALYAQKINELYVHDSGLGEWVLEVRFRGSGGPSKRSTLTPAAPGFVPQPRQVSRSSMKSEATFPRRSDASVATDISTKPTDHVPIVPSLPYPALTPRSLGVPVSLPPSSMRMLSPTPASKTGNFFASLGRKASMSKKERPNPMSFSLSSASSSSTSTRLVKSPPAGANPHPRPVVIANTPSVPGGPRAPPNRALRAQSIMATSPSLASNAAVARRPSLFTPPSSSSSNSHGSSASADRDFERQVDKLADLLPQAERVVLAGYLRRTGQDMLAIGQYLEDEKNGAVRRD
ncbi:hypothetical protein B0H10DRAFT_2210457 [Mycena sp. CBHHK59/15]|nr:hypothetical protein B0H10DRAFT_2210457 [Mycena sp. CBHHK59/15]